MNERKSIVAMLILLLAFTYINAHGSEIKDHSRFKEFPVNKITPRGWLKQYLINQKNGLTGNLDEHFYPFNTCGWTGEISRNYTLFPETDEGQYLAWFPYEQTAYWIDGMLKCGYLLKDEELIEKAHRQIRFVLEHPDEKGLLGPEKARFLNSRWPHAVLFRAFMTEYEVTKDEKILTSLQKHYLNDGYEKYTEGRNVCNIEELCWLYRNTGNTNLYKFAEKAFDIYNRGKHLKGMNYFHYPTILKNVIACDLKDFLAYMHGVSYQEEIKTHIIMYAMTGDLKYKKAAKSGFHILDKRHMLIDGVPSSDEYLNGKLPNICHETCVISDYSWSAGYMLLALGEAEWADRIERACFNAGIGSVTKDFKQHQYMSGPNIIVAAYGDKYSGDKAYFPVHYDPFSPCCAGNVNRIMPNFAHRMWLQDKEGGIVAAMYAPSEIQAGVGKSHQPVIIIENTDYPFSESIEFLVKTDKDVRFPFWLRIPGWCDNPKISVNGKSVKMNLRPGSFAKLERMFMNNDKIVLTLPMKVKLSKWAYGGGYSGSNIGLGLERGPLVFSLPIQEKRVISGENIGGDTNPNKEFLYYSMFPESRWNFALTLSEDKLERQVQVVKKNIGGFPWQLKNAPIELIVPAREIKNWSLLEGINYSNADAYVLNPPLPENYEVNTSEEMIRLVPYGCTLLRLSIFPWYKN